jgi:hypothetical protein
VTAPTETALSPSRSWNLPTVPAPDTPEGRVVLAALIVGVVYVLLLVADDVSLAGASVWFVPLVLILATVVTFSVASMVGSDYARTRQFELELARTVAVHSVAGETPADGTPIGEVLKEYVRTADELRRTSRVHAYAAGPALYGAVTALGAAVFWGISLATGTIWLTYLAILVELPAFLTLVFAVTVLGTESGHRSDVPSFDALTPHRWRHYQQANPAVDVALRGLPWLHEFAEETRTSGWVSTPAAPSPSVVAPTAKAS